MTKWLLLITKFILSDSKGFLEFSFRFLIIIKIKLNEREFDILK